MVFRELVATLLGSVVPIPITIAIPFGSRRVQHEHYDPYYIAPTSSPGHAHHSTGHQKEWEDDSEDSEKYSRSANDKQLLKALGSTVAAEKPKLTWEEVAGLAEAKRELRMAAELPNLQPQLFTGGRKPKKSILLYGPPGTGKGHLVKALASGVDSTLFTISSSDVQSKWIGESERTVKLLFEEARRKKPSIVFIDEVDALCGSRDSHSSSDHDNRVKNEFLVQMDGVCQDNTGILFLFATNLPWKLDPAFRRRLQAKIYIPLPDKEARRTMFKIQVGNTPCKISERDYEEFASRTEGLSGSDINNIVQEALSEALTAVYEATHWRKICREEKIGFIICQASTPGALAMNWRDVPRRQLWVPKVTAADFHKALAKAKPSVCQDQLQNYQSWTEQFGMEGA